MADTRAQLVALQLAFESLATFIDADDGIRAAFMGKFFTSYCCLLEELTATPPI